MSILSLSDSEREHEYSRRVEKEKLISLVESRPVLWDKALDIYKDKAAKAAAWREICNILMDNYEEMAPIDKHDFRKFVIKKWSQTRDSWVRTLKEEKKCKKSRMPSRPYRYHKQMLFLKRVVLTGDYHNASISSKTRFAPWNEQPESNQEIASGSGNKDKMAKTISTEKAADRNRKNEEQEKLKSYLQNANRSANYSQIEDRNLTFFKSLLPSLALLDDDQTLEFHSGVLSLLQSIKRKPAYQEWHVDQSQGYFSQRLRDPCHSPSATSMSTQSQSSDVPDPLNRVKVESE